MQTEEKEYYENKKIFEKEDRYKYLNRKKKNIVIIIILTIILITGIIIFIKSFRSNYQINSPIIETISIENDNIIISINQEVSLNVVINNNDLNPNINYLSSDINIVNILENGTIKGINAGNAVISIIYFDINNMVYTKTINVEVVSN